MDPDGRLPLLLLHQSFLKTNISSFFCSLLLSLSRDRERFDGVCLRRKSVNEKYYTARAHRYSVSILRAECIRLDFVIHEEFDVRKAHSHSRCKLGAAAARNMKKEFINENARHARKYSILATLKKVTELSWIQHGYGGLCHAHPSSGVCILSQSRHSISFYGHGIHKNESLNEVSVDGKFHTTTKSYNIPYIHILCIRVRMDLIKRPENLWPLTYIMAAYTILACFMWCSKELLYGFNFRSPVSDIHDFECEFARINSNTRLDSHIPQCDILMYLYMCTMHSINVYVFIYYTYALSLIQRPTRH